jgi:DNA-binding CsgD family transcriptional regulator
MELSNLEVIEHIHRCDSLEAFPEQLLRELGGLIEHNLAGYNEVNVHLKRAIVTFYPDDDAYQWMVQPFEKNLLQNPVLGFFEDSGEGQAMAISDFLSEDEFHALPIYHEMFEQVQTEDQIVIGLKLDDGIFLSLAFNRSHRGFTHEERQILNLVRPHIARAYLNLAERAADRTNSTYLEAALKESGLGVIEFDATGQVIGSSGLRVMEHLRPFFPSAGEDASAPPESLRELVAGFSLTDSESERHQFKQGDEQLVVHLRKRGDHVLLIASKGVSEKKAARIYGLTNREAEVGRWLCEGKTNQEIAEILNITPDRVKIHMQHIYAKIGVKNRKNAAVVLRRTLEPEQ